MNDADMSPEQSLFGDAPCDPQELQWWSSCADAQHQPACFPWLGPLRWCGLIAQYVLLQPSLWNWAWVLDQGLRGEPWWVAQAYGARTAWRGRGDAALGQRASGPLKHADIPIWFFTWPNRAQRFVAPTLFMSRYGLLCGGSESLRSWVFEVGALHIFLGLLVMLSFESNTV